MHITYYKKLLSALAIIAAVLPFSSSAEVYRSAQFGDSLNQITANVSLPDTFAGGFTTLAVYCKADVAEPGITSNIICYDNNSIADLRRQTNNTLTGATCLAACVDGTVVTVRMQFRV